MDVLNNLKTAQKTLVIICAEAFYEFNHRPNKF